MTYNIVMTADAREDLERFIRYLLYEKQNRQAAKSVLDDFEKTVKVLKISADSLGLCENNRLKSMGYRRINFLSHRYFMLYRIVEDHVFIDNIFHELQDYERKMI